MSNASKRTSPSTSRKTTAAEKTEAHVLTTAAVICHRHGDMETDSGRVGIGAKYYELAVSLDQLAERLLS